MELMPPTPSPTPVAEIEAAREPITTVIAELAFMRKTHVDWADHFEQHPEVEAQYVATGEWDDAKEHRRCVDVYDRAIAALQSLSTARERADRAEQAVKRAVEIADDHCARGKEVTIHHASEPIGVRGGCTITKVGDLVDVRDDLERHVRATVDPDWHFNVTRYRDRAKSDA